MRIESSQKTKFDYLDRNMPMRKNEDQKQKLRGKREDVEHELLQLDSVVVFGLHSLALLVDVRYLLVRHVVLQLRLVLPRRTDVTK